MNRSSVRSPQNFAYFSTACLTLFRDAVSARNAGLKGPGAGQYGRIKVARTVSNLTVSEPVVRCRFAIAFCLAVVSSPSEWLLRRSCPW
jgi:hypothetical protein